MCHQFSQIFTDYFCNLLVDSQSLFLSKLLLCVTVFFEITIVCHYFPQSYYCVLVLIESSATNCACSQCVKRTISAERVKWMKGSSPIATHKVRFIIGCWNGGVSWYHNIPLGGLQMRSMGEEGFPGKQFQVCQGLFSRGVLLAGASFWKPPLKINEIYRINKTKHHIETWSKILACGACYLITNLACGNLFVTIFLLKPGCIWFEVSCSVYQFIGGENDSNFNIEWS